MARKRDAPTLIEVMGKAKPSMATKPDSSAPQEEVLPDTPNEEVQKTFEIPNDPPVSAGVLAARQVRLSGPVVAIAVVALSFLVVGGFWLGRTTGYRAGLKAQQDPGMVAAQNQTPNQAVLGASVENQQPVEEPAVAGADEYPWIEGYTYIRVQDFAADAVDEARLAQEYLDQRGIETVLVKLRGKKVYYGLVTTRGFNLKDDNPEGSAEKRKAEQYITRIREIGQSYRKDGGRYELEGYFVKL